MAKIFDVLSDIHESPNRNTFDLLCKRHMTGKAGVIYPFLAETVVPTDSFEIDTAIGANLMPMWYPTQSNMRFIVHYFFVPMRLLQKNWKNQLEGLQEENFPYMDVPADYYKTGSLADYLGVPTNLVLSEEEIVSSTFKTRDPRAQQSPFNFYSVVYGGLYEGAGAFYGDWKVVSCTMTYDLARDLYEYNGIYDRGLISRVPVLPISRPEVFVPIRPLTNNRLFVTMALVDLGDDYPLPDGAHTPYDFLNIMPDKFYLAYRRYVDLNLFYSSGNEGCTIPVFDMDGYNSFIASAKNPCLLFTINVNEGFSQVASEMEEFKVSSYIEPTGAVASFKYHCSAGTSVEISDFPDYCPYYHSLSPHDDTVKLSAFKFRAYDMTYNSYYRNDKGVQPFVVNGETKYNEYLRTDADGADNNEYELKSRNWELDAYTSCLPSPQQGPAPVIAVNSVGQMRIQDEDGTTSTLDLRDLPDGVGVEVKNADIANPEHARLAMRLTTSGLTIADFRQGNALQRFLEQSLRSGYRYADFIFGHFGKSPSHQELDMPQFLGGYTQVIDTSKISNVSASGDATLGQFAGVGASFGGSKHKVKHYFDDFGILLGVMMLVPDPAYSQILPKDFTYNSRLDWYFPQFSQLGLQPVTYEEVCPIQSHKQYVDGDTSKLLTDTFGYQRPNHEYVWKPDTLHGLFRTVLNGSVISRRFGQRPELNDDFLKIKPEEVNDIFSMMEKNDDIFIAQVVCDIKATRPIPRVVIPSLGR